MLTNYPLGVKVIKLKSLTPLWTGGADGKMDRIHETGIIGSMRWWYEAIIRGLGGFVYDPSAHNKEDEKRCEVAKFYGRTGLRRQFRLETHHEMLNKPYKKSIFIPSGRINKKGRKGGWYLSPGVFGDFQVRIIQITAPDVYDDVSLTWSLPLLLIHHWGALGAKTQHGFGVIEVSDINKLPSSIPVVTRNNSSRDLPHLTDMFFSKISLKHEKNDWWKKVNLIDTLFRDKENGKDTKSERGELEALFKIGCVPISPVLRNWLRYEVANDFNLPKELFGSRDNRTRINISSAYRIKDRWEVRIWGWVPPSKEYERDNVLDSLKAILDPEDPEGPSWKKLLPEGTKDHKLLVWREFNSPRDTVRNINSPEDFLSSLLRGEI